MSVLQNINGSLYRMDASDLAQLAAVDTEGILGGTPGATTNGQTLVDQLAADDVQAQTDIGQIKTDLSDEVKARSILGAHNFLNVFRNITYPYTSGNIVYSADKDGVLTANGNGSGNAEVALYGRVDGANPSPLCLPVGKYIYSGRPDVDNENVDIYVANTVNGAYHRIGGATSGTKFEFEITSDMLESGKDYCAVGVYVNIRNSQNVSNLVFKPMIRLKTDADDTFLPHAMTNRELTTDFFTALFSHPVTLTSSDNLNDITTAGLYVVISSVPTNAPTGMSNTFSVVLVFNMGNRAAYTQIYIQGGWRQDSKHIAIRGFGGNPAAWSVWRYVTDATS